MMGRRRQRTGGGGLHGILLLFTDYDCAWLGTQYLETDGLMY